MRKMRLGTSDLEVSNISLGCMGMGKLTKENAAKVIHNAMELGIDFFDHADIYAGGKSEEIFADAIDMNPSIREKIITKQKQASEKGTMTSRKNISWNPSIKV